MVKQDVTFLFEVCAQFAEPIYVETDGRAVNNETIHTSRIMKMSLSRYHYHSSHI